MGSSPFTFDPNRFMIDDVLDLVKQLKKEQKKKKKKSKKKEDLVLGKNHVIKNNTDNYYLKSRKS